MSKSSNSKGTRTAVEAADESLPLEGDEGVLPLEFHGLSGAEIIALGLTGLWKDDPIEDPAAWVRKQRENP